MRVAADPGLYDPLPDEPALNGATCADCGRVYFPPLALGCEVCGAQGSRLTATPLPAEGVVFALAAVNLNPQDGTPFTVAEVCLDSGPLIRAVVHQDCPALRIGDRVRGQWRVLAHGEDGAETVEPALMTATQPEGAQR